MRLFNCLILFLILVPELYADHGIYFKSKEVTKEQRTGVDITHNSTISYTESFTIHFNISFRETNTHYGEVLSLKETNGNNLIQVTYRRPELFVIHNKRETKFQINLLDEEIENNRWVDFELHIDAINNTIHFKFSDKKFQSAIDFPQNSDFALSLGVINRYGFFIDEVPSISIKDLSIRIDRAPKHLWPFKKTNDVLLRDVLSSRTAKLYNADWVVDYHNKWEKLKTLNFSSVPSMLYDFKKEQINFIFINGQIKSFDPKTKMIIPGDTSVTGFPSFEEAQQIIYDQNHNINAYSYNKSLISYYDTIKKRWNNNIEFTVENTPRLWHHNKLLHPINKNITTLCGYGYYSYFNDILSYNSSNKTWDRLQFTGDTIEPRYLASLGHSTNNENVVYLFGGMGNSMGKQILGKEFYYDFFKIDFKNQNIEQLWEYEYNEQFQHLPVNSMKVTENDSSFYTLMFPSQKQNTHLKVVKGFINEPSLIFIGDSIPYNFLDIESFADLYYWDSENKLIALTSHRKEDLSYEVNIYTISYEPGDKDDLRIYRTSLPLSGKIFYSLLAVCLVLLAFIIRKRIKNIKQKEPDHKVLEIPDTLISDYQIPTTSAILLFGGFQVYDNKGKDITYRFSPTLKELFLLILLNTLDGGKGISSKRIQEYLWPGKTESKAKNNRGVNIKKLRVIMEDIPGTEIIFDNNYWKTTYPECVFCDLEYIQKSLTQIRENNEVAELDEIIAILKRGAILRDMFPEWLDSYKDKNTDLIVSTLEKIIKDSRYSKAHILIISNVIFEFDEMNEAALKSKCCILAEQGKHSLAIETFEHYKRLYHKLYNEEYQYSFKDIVAKE